MAKYLKQGFVRELEWKLNREEISYSKMVELMEEECIKNSMEWLKEYRLNLMSLMGQDDYVTGKLDVIKDILDKFNTKER
jgi:hypothetical protein